jgi:hypothetical protein
MRKNIKIGLLGTLVGVALIIWAAAPRSASVAAAAGSPANCNVANVAGTYAYAAFGTVFAGNPAGFPPGAYNSVATLKLDGAGNYVIDAVTSYNGVIVPEHFEGTYVVGDDCQVTYYLGDLAAVLGIATNNRSAAQGMSLIPGTNVTFLTVRK